MNGLISGTPEYMSPEQGRGGAIDGRSDLYACGVLLYQLVTGTLPFEDRSAVGVLLMHLNERPVPPSQRFAGVPAALDAVIMRALEKAPDARFPNARAMRAALHALLDDYDAALGITRGRATTVPPATFLPEKIAALPRAPMQDVAPTRTLAGATEPPPVAPSNRSQRRPMTDAPRVLEVRGLESRSHRVRNGLALLVAVALFGGVSAATLMHDAGTRPLAPVQPTHAARSAPSPPAVASVVAAQPSAPAVARAVVAAAEEPALSPVPAVVKPPAAREPSRTEVPRVRPRASRVGQIADHVLRASMLSAALAGTPAATRARPAPSAPRVTLGRR